MPSQPRRRRPVAPVTARSRPPVVRLARSSALTKTCTPDGEVMPGQQRLARRRGCGRPRARAAPCARAATASTGGGGQRRARCAGTVRGLVDDDVGVAVAPPRRPAWCGVARRRANPSASSSVATGRRRSGSASSRNASVGAAGDRRAARDQRRARAGRAGGELVLEEDQRPHRVPRGDVGVGLADHVAEHLERDRAAVARRRRVAATTPGDVERALAGEAAEVPAPLEHVHVQQRGVGDLQEADPVAGDAGERGAVVAAREHVEGVDGQGDGGVVGAAYGLPGLADPVDVPSPGERLEGDGHAALGGEPRRARAAARPTRSRSSTASRPTLRAGQQDRSRRARPSRRAWRATRCSTASNRSGAHALDVADRLEEVDRSGRGRRTGRRPREA